MAKRIETRDWGTPYRGYIAIHAAKRWGPDQRDSLHEIEWYLSNTDHSNYLLHVHIKPKELGCFVALAELVQCFQMDRLSIEVQDPLEVVMGGWTPGRWAWVFDNVTPLVPPVPAKGRQRLWTLNPEGELAQKILANVEGGV